MNHTAALTYARNHGVSATGFHALLVVLNENPVIPTRIAAVTGMSPAVVTGVCDRLVADGWVTRGPNPHSRRSVLVTATPKAFDAFERFVETEP